jgi:hypothetical protein
MLSNDSSCELPAESASDLRAIVILQAQDCQVARIMVRWIVVDVVNLHIETRLPANAACAVRIEHHLRADFGWDDAAGFHGFGGKTTRFSYDTAMTSRDLEGGTCLFCRALSLDSQAKASHPEDVVKLTLPLAILASSLSAEQTPTPQPFFVGNRLGLPINPAADGVFEAISSNVKVVGAIYSPKAARMMPSVA